MRGVKRCQGSTGRMKTHRDHTEVRVSSVKMACFYYHDRLHYAIDGCTFPEEDDRL
jgi:hypothetical protein